MWPFILVQQQQKPTMIHHFAADNGDLIDEITLTPLDEDLSLCNYSAFYSIGDDYQSTII